MSFYRNEIRTARKERKCDMCNGVIKIDEKYHNKAGNQDGDIWSSSECESCQSVVSEFLENGSEDGYCEEYIRDWWVEEKCPKCVSYWPNCEQERIDASCEEDFETCNCRENGKCKGNDYCDNMTHYCRCENFKEVEV